MSPDRAIPTRQTRHRPEFAALAVLDVALAVAAEALAAVHPGANGCGNVAHLPPEACSHAQMLLLMADELWEEVRLYLAGIHYV